MIVGDGLRRAAKLGQVLDAAAFAARHRSDLGSPVLYDIGGRGGLHGRWELARRFGLIRPILFEPDPAERARLATVYSDSTVIGFAVGDVEGPASLYVTAEPGCSSLMEPDMDSLRAQGLAHGRDIVSRLPVETRRIDLMVAEALLPPPTYVKMDVQGFEKRVLDGMGVVIDHVVAIELELRLVPAYHGKCSSQRCSTP